MGEARQLDIFKTKRQRGIKPRGPSEFEIHCCVTDYLRAGLAPGWTWFHVPNGGERPAFINSKGRRVSPEGGRLKRMGVKDGVSDILLVKAPAAQLHALELKRGGEEPTDEQYNFMNEVIALGGVATWADSVEAAFRILTDWGAISTRIHLQGG